MTGNDSPYNDQAWDISSVPSWKSPPQHGAYAPNAKLSPRGKAAIGAGAVVLAATGMFAWSNYASAQADAHVREAQIALDASKLDLQRQQQTAELAKAGETETAAQKARREAVQACVAKVGAAYGAIADCGKAYPVVDAPGMVNTAAQTAAADGGDSTANSSVGLLVLGGVGVVIAVSWVKKRLPRT